MSLNRDGNEQVRAGEHPRMGQGGGEETSGGYDRDAKESTNDGITARPDKRTDTKWGVTTAQKPTRWNKEIKSYEKN